MSRILVLTGDGKGKTSAALGMALRASGYGMSVCLIQFVKKHSTEGEACALALLPRVALHSCGLGFIPAKQSPQYSAHVKAAHDGLVLAKTKLADPGVDMVILDEVCNAVFHGLISEEQLIVALKQGHSNAIVICTGRNAGQSLIALADTVSRIECVKHAYAQGTDAQKGVEI